MRNKECNNPDIKLVKKINRKIVEELIHLCLINLKEKQFKAVIHIAQTKKSM